MSAKPEFRLFHTSGGAKTYRIPLEAFPNFWAWAYLVRLKDWLVLIDTGSGSELSNAGLDAGFAQAGITAKDLTHILLTHGHIDHYGGLSYLRESSQALIGVHELDSQTISSHASRLALLGNRLHTFLVQSGVPEPRRAELLQMYRFTKSLYRSVPTDITYEANNMQIGPIEMLHVPGHCAGHVAMKMDDVIFCGDILLKGITPHQSPESLLPFMGVRHYLMSLSIFERWASGARLILNGHDEPIEDLAANLASVRQNLSHRISQTLEAFSVPGTVAEATERVYGEINGYNALLVIEKIGAYVEFLDQSGLLEVTNPEELEREASTTAIKYRKLKSVLQSEILPKEKRYVFV